MKLSDILAELPSRALAPQEALFRQGARATARAATPQRPRSCISLNWSARQRRRFRSKPRAGYAVDAAHGRRSSPRRSAPGAKRSPWSMTFAKARVRCCSAGRPLRFAAVERGQGRGPPGEGRPAGRDLLKHGDGPCLGIARARRLRAGRGCAIPARAISAFLFLCEAFSLDPFLSRDI